MAVLEAVYLYDSPDTAGLSVPEVVAYLGDLMPTVATRLRTDYFTHHLARFQQQHIEVLSQQLAARLQERELANHVIVSLALCIAFLTN